MEGVGAIIDEGEGEGERERVEEGKRRRSHSLCFERCCDDSGKKKGIGTMIG